MCGRYTLRNPERIPTPAELLERFGRDHADEAAGLLVPRYNIAPSQRVLVVGRDAAGEQALRPATWGFRPRWLSAERKAPINARAETAPDKPMFRGAFRWGRCLVPADGWYEWQARDSGPKQPYFFRGADDAVFWFAGLAATDAAGARTMAILTTDANRVAQAVHGRMPVVIADDEAACVWLDPDAAKSTLRDLLAPARDDLVETNPIDRAVDRPQNDGPELVRPLAE